MFLLKMLNQNLTSSHKIYVIMSQSDTKNGFLSQNSIVDNFKTDFLYKWGDHWCDNQLYHF